MARLTNTPQQQLQFDLERRKSYSFRCVLLNADRSPLDLTNCKLRFVMKAREYDNDLYDTTNVIVNHEARILSPESGEATFACLAGVSGGIAGILASVKGADKLLVIDGCPVACAKKTVDAAGLAGYRYQVVTDTGVKKVHAFQLDEADIQKTVAASRAKLA